MRCSALAAEGFAGEPTVVRTLSMRYAGQNYEREVPLPAGTVDDTVVAGALDAFHELHHEVYGYSFPGETIELIHANVTALGAGARPALPRLQAGPLPEPRERREVRFGGRGPLVTAVYRREDLPGGAALAGTRSDRGARLDDPRPPRPGAARSRRTASCGSTVPSPPPRRRRGAASTA